MESTLTYQRFFQNKPAVPPDLVREEFDGVPLYYRGYRDVLSGSKTLDDIMAAGGLHALLVTFLVEILLMKLDRKRYRVLTGEVGSLFAKGKKATMDVAIFEKAVLTQAHINRRLPRVAPVVNIEVDVNIENPDLTEDEIVKFRTEKMLEGGIEKVIWVFTLQQKVLIAEKGKVWQTVGWEQDVEILDGIVFNIHKYLEEEGFELAVLLK